MRLFGVIDLSSPRGGGVYATKIRINMKHQRLSLFVSNFKNMPATWADAHGLFLAFHWSDVSGDHVIV